MMAIEVPDHMLYDFLHGVGNFHEAAMVRKGREIKNQYVKVIKGDRGYLSDIFVAKEGVGPPKDTMVVAKEWLFCNGRENCMRACGRMGECRDDCEKRNGDDRAKSGHRCSFRVSLKMTYRKLGIWQVVIAGSHVPPTCVWERPKQKSHLMASEHFVGGRGPTPQHPDPVPFNPLIATNTGRFQSNISGISIKGEPGGTSNVVSPEVDIHETKPQISQLHDSVPTSSSQVRPSGVRNTPTAQFRPSFAQQRVARAQQVRHGNIQMGGRGGMASRPQPHSSHPRMSAPSSTVTSSAPPLKRPRLDPPRQVLQMSGNQQIRQAPVQRQNIGGFNQTQARMPVSRNAIGSSNRQQPPGPIGRPMQPRLLSGSPQRQGLRPSLQQLNVNANRQSKSDSSERAFLNPDHSSHIMTELSALWKSGKFVDAAVLVGGMKLQAHRMVLFAASPYLRASFDSMNPAAELRLKMPSDIKLDIVFQFLTYIYDGVLKLNPSNVISLLKISLMLQMEHLTACCREYIAQAVKMGTMQRFQEQNVETPLLVLVDHKAPETGQMKADMCTQTVTDSGRVQSIPRVDFERVFGEDRQSDQAGTQFDQGYQDIQSDVDLYRNYGTDGFKPDEDEGEGVHGEQVMHTSNEDDEGDDDDATPMMIIKNEFIDPEYELSLNAHHGTSPAADCDNASTSSNQTESRFEPETTVRNSDDPPDPGESTVSEPMQVVPGVDLDTSSQSSSDLPDHTLDQSTQEGGTHSPMNSSAIDSTQPSENSSSVLHSEIDTAPSIDTSLTTSSETDFTRNQSDQVNRTSSVSKGESSGVADNSLTITPSGPEQSESLDESGDQATPQFGTEEFLSSDFDLHPTKTEPKDPM